MSELTGNDLPHEMSNGLIYDFSEDKNVCLSVRLSVCPTDYVFRASIMVNKNRSVMSRV